MNIDAWLDLTITVSPITGRSGSGDPTYGPQVTMKARLERNVRLKIGVDNALQDVHALVTSQPIVAGSRVWFPGDNTAQTNAARRPLAVKSASTKGGAYMFYETYFAA